jgi:hypothetical protein
MRFRFWKKQNGKNGGGAAAAIANGLPTATTASHCRTTIQNSTDETIRVVLLDIRTNKMLQPPPFIWIAGRAPKAVELQRSNCTGDVAVEVVLGHERFRWIATPRKNGLGSPPAIEIRTAHLNGSNRISTVVLSAGRRPQKP